MSARTKRKMGAKAPSELLVAFQRQLGDKVEAHLRKKLRPRFASVDDVIALIRHQLSFTHLSPDTVENEFERLPSDPQSRKHAIAALVLKISKGVEEAAYVEDCERVAQYLNRKTPPDVREGIRGYYRQRYWDWARGKLAAYLLFYFNNDRGKVEACLGDAEERLDEKAFSPESFARVTGEYRAANGRTFAMFIRQWIVWRSIDVAKTMAREEIERCLAELVAEEARGDDMPLGGWVGELDTEEAERVRDALRQCLDRLGIEERTVLELRWKAYVSPDDVAPGTLEVVKGVWGQGGIEEVIADYEKCRARISKLRARLRKAELERDRAYVGLALRREELEGVGYSGVVLDRLEGGTSGEIEERDWPGAWGQPRNRKLEDEYVEAWRKYERAKRRLEKLRCKWAKYKNMRLPWVRSQPEIERLTGIDQSTISRRLTSGTESLRKCLKRKLAQRE
jgi:RNA polymerase sigma factor (sigma-70 family)